MKKFVHLYDNVVKWDDSAGEEAFHNAKKRFLAKMHGIPCDMSLPNPDLYIDEVDWDSEVDPELLLDLDREYTIPDASENHETVVIFGDVLYRNEAFSTAGWGETEENFRKATNSSSNNLENPWEKTLRQPEWTANDNGWGEAVECTPPLGDGGGTVGDTGWEVRRETSWLLDQCDYNGTNNGIVRRRWDFNNEKREDAGGFVAMNNNASRLYGNNHKGAYKWRNKNDHKRVTFAHENSTPRCWKPINSCGSLSYHTSGEAGQTW